MVAVHETAAAAVEGEVVALAAAAAGGKVAVIPVGDAAVVVAVGASQAVDIVGQALRYSNQTALNHRWPYSAEGEPEEVVWARAQRLPTQLGW